MTEGGRLGLLEMGVGGDDRFGVALSDVGEGEGERVKLVVSLAGGAAGVETHVEGHLIIAGSGGVQLARGVTDKFEQSPLHRRVNVLVRVGELEFPTGSFGLDGLQPTEESRHVGLSQDPRLAEHQDVGPRACNVVGEETPVRDIGGVRPQRLARARLEATTPQAHSTSPPPNPLIRRALSEMKPSASAWR